MLKIILSVSLLILILLLNIYVSFCNERKTHCNEINGYLYYTQSKNHQFISIPVIDKNGEMIKCK